jgi:hypothetical protein
VSGPRDIQTGIWSFELTSVRSDSYNGVNYQRESAPSVCQQINLSNHFDNVTVAASNVPGATSYNIYAAPPGNGCAGPFGLAANLPVTGSVTNTNTSPCPIYTGAGCSLGNESVMLSAQLASPWAPNGAASPGTTGAYPPDSETAPLASGLPNQNAPMGTGAHGDRANENNCETIGGAYATCPADVTPGAVELYFPGNACIVLGNSGDTYVFSGDQYNWISVYEPPSNGCSTNTLAAHANSAFIGLIYAPGADFSVASPYVEEAPGVGGLLAGTVTLSGSLPSITYSSTYAPVPPASRLTS